MAQEQSTKELLAEVSEVRASLGKSSSPSGENKISKFFTGLLFETDAVEPQNLPVLEEEPVFDTTELSTKSLNEIYTEAGISSPYGIDKLAELVNSEELASQPISMKKVAVPFTLKALGHTLETPIQDAIEKDKALKSYAQALHNDYKVAVQNNKAKETEIEEELKGYFAVKQAEIEALRQDTLNRESACQAFKDKKKAEEQRMSDTVGMFLEAGQNPITVGDNPEEEKPLDTPKV